MFLHVCPFSLFSKSFLFLCILLCFCTFSFFVLFLEHLFFFDYPFSVLLFYILSIQKTTFFSELFPFLRSPFFFRKRVLSPSSCFLTTLEKKTFNWKLTHFGTSVFHLFTFTSTNSTFSLLECLLCLFISSFCSSSCSISCLSVFSRLFHFFRHLNFSLFLGLGLSLCSLYLYLSLQFFESL